MACERCAAAVSATGSATGPPARVAGRALARRAVVRESHSAPTSASAHVGGGHVARGRRRTFSARSACRARPAERPRPALRAVSARSLRTPTGTRRPTPARTDPAASPRPRTSGCVMRSAWRGLAPSRLEIDVRDGAILADDLEPARTGTRSTTRSKLVDQLVDPASCKHRTDE